MGRHPTATGMTSAEDLTRGLTAGSIAVYAGGMGADYMSDSQLRRHRGRAYSMARLAFFASNFTLVSSLMVGSAIDATQQATEDSMSYSAYTVSLRFYAALIGGFGIGAGLFGPLMDRVSTRRAAVLAGAIALAGTIASAVLAKNNSSNDLAGPLVIARGVSGVGLGGMYPVAALLTSAASTSEARGRQLAITFTMQLAGFGAAAVSTDLLLQFICVPQVASEPGEMLPCSLNSLVSVWRLLMSFEAVILVVLLAVSYQLRPPKRAKPLTEVTHVERPGLCSVFCGKRLRELVAVSIPWLLVDAVMYGNSLLGGRELIGVNVFGPGDTVKNFVLVNLVLLGLNSPGYLVSLCLIDKIGRRKLQLFGFGALSVCYAFLGVASIFLPSVVDADQWTYPLLLTLANCFATMGPGVTTFVSAAETSDKLTRGTTFGVAVLAGKAGALGGLALFRYLGTPTMHRISVVFGVCAALAAIGGMATLWSDDRLGQTLEHQNSYMRLLSQQPSGASLQTEAKVKQDWSIPFDQLHVGRQIAAGAFGRVFLGRYVGSTVAIKELFLSRATTSDVEDFKHEHQLLSSLHHPNIVTYFGASMSHPYYYIVTEFVPHCLERMLFTDPVAPSQLQLEKVARDVVKGMAFLHSRGVVHRDIKPSNVLVDESGVAKLCDFGMARLSRQSVTFALGTIAYTAPEVIKVTEGLDWQKADVYAFGSTLYEMMHRKKLFEGMTDYQIMDMVVRQKRRPKVQSSVPTFVSVGPHYPSPNSHPVPPRYIAKIINSCWRADPAKRPSFEQLVYEFRKRAKTSFGGNADFPASGSLGSSRSPLASMAEGDEESGGVGASFSGLSPSPTPRSLMRGSVADASVTSGSVVSGAGVGVGAGAGAGAGGRAGDTASTVAPDRRTAASDIGESGGTSARAGGGGVGDGGGRPPSLLRREPTFPAGPPLVDLSAEDSDDSEEDASAVPLWRVRGGAMPASRQ